MGEEEGPWSRSYVIWSSLNWLMFLAAVGFLTWGTGRGGLPQIAVVGIIVTAAVSVAMQFVAAYRLVSAQDEFVRGIAAKRAIAAAGVTLTIAVFWGLFQQFLTVPVIPLWVVYPLFWAAFGMVTPFIRTSRA